MIFQYNCASSTAWYDASSKLLHINQHPYTAERHTHVRGKLHAEGYVPIDIRTTNWPKAPFLWRCTIQILTPVNRGLILTERLLDFNENSGCGIVG